MTELKIADFYSENLKIRLKSSNYRNFTGFVAYKRRNEIPNLHSKF